MFHNIKTLISIYVKFSDGGYKMKRIEIIKRIVDLGIIAVVRTETRKRY